MRLLLDTHILLWALIDDRRLSAEARALIDDSENKLLYSAVSVAEVAVKFALGRPDFRFAPEVVHRQLRHDGYVELPLTGDQDIAADPQGPVRPDADSAGRGGGGAVRVRG